MTTLGVVTTSRADFGIYQPVLRTIEADDALDLKLFVTGSHLSDAHGRTERLIADAGFDIDHRIELSMQTDTATGVIEAIAAGVREFRDALTAHTQD